MQIGIGITPSLFSAVSGGGSSTDITLSNASVSSMGTAGPLDNLSADGFTWAQGDNIKVDQYGTIYSLAQSNSGNNDIDFVYSNDGGSTWASTALGQGFITRGYYVIDDVNDIAHVLWKATATSDGMIYRRYTISRDGSNNVTGFTRDLAINLQLDFNASQYEHPVLLHLTGAAYGTYGALLAIWGARNSAGTPSKWEIRASMRILSNTSADNTAGNWVAPITDDATTMTQDAAVPYSIVASGTADDQPYVSAARKPSGTNANDVYVFWHEGSTSGPLRFRRMRWNSGSNDWSTGLSSTVTILASLQRGGTDTGYSLKYQLHTTPHFDTQEDQVWVGFASWLDNANGDTWSIVPIDNTDTVGTIIDVYSAGGTHSFAPTGDLMYDSVSGQMIVTYLTSDAAQNNNRTQIVSYNDGVLDEGPITFTSAENTDIPIIHNGRYDGKLLLTWRDAINSPSPPYQGYFATIDIA